MSDDFLKNLFANPAAEQDTGEATQEPVQDAPEVDSTPDVAPEQETKAKVEPTEKKEDNPRESHHVPLSVFRELREDYKDLKRRFQEQETSKSQPNIPEQSREPRDTTSELYERIQKMEEQIQVQKLTDEAVKRFGYEEVEASRNWMVTQIAPDPETGKIPNPALLAALNNHPDPMAFMRDEYLNQKLLNEIKNDREGWIRQEFAKLSGTQTQAPPIVRTAPAKSPLPPSSTINHPNAGKTSQPGQLSGVERLMKGQR